ncbi:hypothetical protein BYT27DRAFT_6876236 [Phlegmacium glaucopus]|nr:hypothetical protein BYT27DRAFT_6876236 [Phlegmacium glaucopus]
MFSGFLVLASIAGEHASRSMVLSIGANGSCTNDRPCCPSRGIPCIEHNLIFHLDELVLWLAIEHDVVTSALQDTLQCSGLTRISKASPQGLPLRGMKANDDFLLDGSQSIFLDETRKTSS